MSRSHPTAPLDPQLAAIVAALRQRGAALLFEGDLQATRRAMDAAAQPPSSPPGPVAPAARVEDTVLVHQGLRVPARIYRPAQAGGPCPTVVFFHGGGFALGSVAAADGIARSLQLGLHSVVVSVDYRLAPEHPFPAAHDDALAAVEWALDHADRLGGDAARVAVAGESAGANLAASCALLLRGRARRPMAQLLVVPGVDMARDTVALEDGTDYPLLTPADLRAIVRLYMGGRGDESAGFPPSPLHAPSLAGAPPAVVALAGHDPLREEGRRYAHRLQDAGVAVALLEFPTLFHPFLGFQAVSEGARHANVALCEAFAALLAPA